MRVTHPVLDAAIVTLLAVLVATACVPCKSVMLVSVIPLTFIVGWYFGRINILTKTVHMPISVVGEAKERFGYRTDV